MPLDELKDLWASQEAHFERSLRLDERLLRETLVRKTRWALVPNVLMRAVEIAAGAAFVSAVVPVVAAHRAEAVYAWLGGAVVAFSLAVMARSGYLIGRALLLDWSTPVVSLQRALDCLRLAEARSTIAAVLGGVLLWLPAGLILVEALGGPAALARVDRPWLAANLGFGLLTLAGAVAWSRRYAGAPGLGPLGSRVADALSGRALRRARASLDELARFERE